MIDPKCFGAEWQERKRSELGGCDPVLLEKTIHAFALLDALAEKGLEFIFKGGTSLLLRLPRIRRLSIDADIICEQPDSSLDRLLAEVSQSRPFTRMAEDGRGPNRLPSRRHFKFYYVPLDPRNPAPFVLLDVVKERSLYPKVEALPLRTAFVEGDGSLLVPTVEGLLGDKLTAFGPNTTGIPLSDRYSMQFMKQVSISGSFSSRPRTFPRRGRPTSRYSLPKTGIEAGVSHPSRRWTTLFRPPAAWPRLASRERRPTGAAISWSLVAGNLRVTLSAPGSVGRK